MDMMDIVNDPVDRKSYKEAEDPRLYVSKRTGRGPLNENWIQTQHPLMTAYKLCRVEFSYWGMQGKIERFIHSTALRRTMLVGHRQVC